MDLETKPVKLIVLNPGHFHAALVQKQMYAQVDPVVHVYGPEGQDMTYYLLKIDQYNKRQDDPTSWETVVYTGHDYLERMCAEKKGNVVVIAGNNQKKTSYIHQSLMAGFHVLADKPMVIDEEDFQQLEDAFRIAEEKDLLLYDIMTERFEITTILQKELADEPGVFGELITGSAEEPAVTKESVHHFFKYVSGEPLIRPAWAFDIEQQGEGIIDVSTHLVDLIQWSCFPQQIIDYGNDIEIENATRWTTGLNAEQFVKVTGLNAYPEYLQKYLEDDLLKVYANGNFVYRINGIFARVSVIWNFQAPEGTGDTHYSIMRGSKADLIISQQAEEQFIPELYIVLHQTDDIFEATLREVIKDRLHPKYPGLGLKSINERKWKILIPGEYRVGHEAHFSQVVNRFLEYLANGSMPAWEKSFMRAKYFTTVSALQYARQNDQQ